MSYGFGPPPNGYGAPYGGQGYAMEQTFFAERGVTVTNQRVISGPATFPLNGIGGVTTVIEPPSYAGPIILLIFGVIFLLAYGAGIVLIVISIFRFATRRATFILRAMTSTGPWDLLRSHDAYFVQRVGQAVYYALSQQQQQPRQY